MRKHCDDIKLISQDFDKFTRFEHYRIPKKKGFVMTYIHVYVCMYACMDMNLASAFKSSHIIGHCQMSMSILASELGALQMSPKTKMVIFSKMARIILTGFH
jgi:hypothetical protein